MLIPAREACGTKDEKCGVWDHGWEEEDDNSQLLLLLSDSTLSSLKSFCLLVCPR